MSATNPAPEKKKSLDELNKTTEDNLKKIGSQLDEVDALLKKLHDIKVAKSKSKPAPSAKTTKNIKYAVPVDEPAPKKTKVPPVDPSRNPNDNTIRLSDNQVSRILNVLRKDDPPVKKPNGVQEAQGSMSKDATNVNSLPQDPNNQSPDTLFAAFDKDINRQMTSHIAKAVSRGLDKSRRALAKDIAAETLGHEDPSVSQAIDKLPNAKVFEILTAHQQTQEFRNQQMEMAKNEEDVVGKKIDNTKKLNDIASAQTKAESDKQDLAVKEEERLAVEGHQPGVSTTGIMAPVLEDVINKAVSTNLIDRSGSPTSLIARAGSLQAKVRLGLFPSQEDRIKAIEAIRSLTVEAASRTGIPFSAVQQNVLASSAQQMRSVSDNNPVRGALFGLRSKEGTAARLNSAFFALKQESMSSATSSNIISRKEAARVKALKIDPEDPIVQESQRLGERLTQEAFVSGDVDGLLMQGISKDGTLRLPDAGDIGYLSEAYQTLLTARASAQSQGLPDQVKRFDMALDNHVDKVLEEWIATTNDSPEGIRQALEKASTKLQKMVGGPDGLIQTSKSTSKLGVAQSSGVIFQVQSARDYMQKLKDRLPQKLLERKQRRRAEDNRKASANKRAANKFGTSAGAGAGPGKVPLFAPIDFKKLLKLNGPPSKVLQTLKDRLKGL